MRIVKIKYFLVPSDIWDQPVSDPPSDDLNVIRDSDTRYEMIENTQNIIR